MNACSVCDEISSVYAQCAMKFVLRMLSINLHLKTVHILLLAEHARKFVPRMLSVRCNRSSKAQCATNRFRVCSQNPKLKCKFRLKEIKSLKNRLGSHQIGPNWKNFFGYLSKKFGSAYAQSPRKYLNFKILAKIEGQEANFFQNFTKGI
jgi:hypothetical protein